MMNLAALEAMITPEVLLKLSPEALQELQERIKALTTFKRYNRIEFFNPFEYQRKFIRAGKEFQIRYMRAANRLGKTYGAAAEFAMHLIGEYPADWEGRRVDTSGHNFLCIGIDLDSTARVLQGELIGSHDCRIKEDVGTGAIPRKNIILDEGWNQDGQRLRSCQIRHKDGGRNTLYFFGAENVATTWGMKIGVCWIDEEAFNGMEVYSNAITRLNNAFGPGQDGFMILTATPERGNTLINQLFDNDETGLLYLQQVSLDECPLYTLEQIEQIIARYPENQRQMRRHGIPVLGEGAIFSIPDEKIRIAAVNPGPDWLCVAGVDLGTIIDPSVIIIALYDPHEDVFYIYDEIYLNESEEARSPRGIANALLASDYRGIPVIVPHDAGLNSDATESKGKMLRRLGVNVLGTFRNPPQTSLKVQYVNTGNHAANNIETGLNEQRLMLEEGRLKVMERCKNWFLEKGKYFYKVNKTTGKTKPDGDDHAMDAARYAVMSLIGGKGCRWDQVYMPDANHLTSYQSVNINF
ncbi:terminase family protein [Salmonella enterica subsp. enterica]